ncbi:DNA repair protein RecN [Bacillus kwashiorkori]|uniref:DNA repair protein RecN n=1 Tax=Bacillus kwashiorkori TaxID=1522318 RepID=UPI000784F23A|nr:DNA repair protein RecN [Bacillus kwashiorkori]
MLAELSIKNFAIIDEIHISFDSGFIVLTGETGAGKSILIDAIQLLVGGRGSSDFVRHGTDKAEIEGLFLVEENHPSLNKLSEFGIESEEGMVVIRRDIFQNGKSTCRINGKLVTISILREVGRTLVDIHGQHEHQELLDERSHIKLLDEFGGVNLKLALKEYQDLYHEYEKIKRDFKRLTENEQEMAQRLDLLKFQLEEITKANLQLNEDELLLAEKKKYSNYEKLFTFLSTSYEALQGEQKGLDWISLVQANLESAAAVDEEYQSIYEQVANCFYQLEDILHVLRNELDNLEYNPDRLMEVDNRLMEINQLKRKYGQTIEEILEYGAKIEEEVETIENRESYVSQLDSKLRSVEKDLIIEAENLTSIRKKTAITLTTAIQQELKSLYMDKTVFEVFFAKDVKQFKYDGMDQIQFLISTNPGEPLKPLSKVASGGELSRIMLALKAIFSKHQGVTSIIFDEVDTGVSGKVAQAIGEKIYQISLGSQVLSITHLPQVAAIGDIHYFIAKTVENERTITTITTLTEAGRIKEIARMISGAKITASTESHAKEMLDLANKMKEKNEM